MERQFTRQAENALKLATTIAKSCGHGYIGTEHLLAGLLKEPEGTAGKVLQEFNVEEEKLRELISSLVTPVQGNTAVAETKDPQYSPRARRIIEQAKEDAESMECLCGTEHLSAFASERDRLRSDQAAFYNGSKYPEVVCGYPDSYGI